MLWDVTPLGFGRDWAGAAQINAAVGDVLEEALTLPNVACLESALHGLGHLKLSARIKPSDQEARIDAVFARFLNAYQDGDPLVRRYAEAAALGGVY